MFSDEELKKRERVVLKLQEEKGELRDVIYQRDKEIKRLKEVIHLKDLEIEKLTHELEEERKSKDEVDTNKVNLEAKLARAKEKYLKKQEELKMQKNITQKFRDNI